MKNIALILGLLFTVTILNAQTPPEKINYQAVARDLSGNPLVNQTLNVTYEIRQSSPTGTSVYTETHTGIPTNQFGLFTAEIGGGTPSTGTFPGINWGAGLYYLYVEVNGDPMGSSQLLSVPYALYAKQSANGPQGLPGNNSISIVTPEPIGINCPTGGNKIDIGTDDNGDNSLQALEIDYTYYVCNGDSGAAGIGVNWLGNGITFPPTPNSENDAFYHSTHNTSYIYNGTSWDTLVSGNVGSAGFWTQTGNTIYNNNNSNLGNVSIGTSLSLSKLTVGSVDSTVATFLGNNANVAVIAVANANATGTSGIAFVNGSNSNAFMAYSPSNKTLSIVNGVTDGHLLLNADSSIFSNSLVIANQAQKIANQAQTSIYNSTDTIYSYSPNGPIINANSGTFLTDSLYVLGNNFFNANWVLANDGSGQAKWTDPNTLGLGNDNWGTQVVVSDSSLNGTGVTGSPLSVNGVLTDNQDLILIGNTLSITNGNSVTLPTPPTYTAGTGINLSGNVITNTAPDQTVALTNGTGINVTGTYPNFTINNTSPATSISLTGTGMTSISGTNPNYTINTPAQTLTYTAPNLTLSNGGGTVTLPTSPWIKTGNFIHHNILTDSVGIGTNSPYSKLHISGSYSSVGNIGTFIDLQNTFGSSTSPAKVGIRFKTSNFPNGQHAKGGIIYSRNSSNARGDMLFLNNSNDDISEIDIANDVRLIIKNDGNIGIGTTTPLAKLHVEQNNSAVMMLKEVTPTSGAAFVMESFSQFVLISNESGTFRIEDNTNSNQPFNINPSGQVGIGGDAFHSALDVYGRITMRNGAIPGYVPVSNANGTMTWTDPNTLITLPTALWSLNGTSIYNSTLSHNVGIGTTTPGLITGASKYLSIMNTGPYIVGSITSLELGGNTSGGNAPASYIDFINNTSTPSNIARITARTSGTSTLEGQLAFSTNDGTLSERMRIDEAGNVGIGTTSPSQKLDVNGTINISSNTGEVNNSAKTGAANLVPIAYGSITNTGTILNVGTGNFTVTWDVANSRYLITIIGESYHFSNYITTVTPISSANLSTATNSVGGDLVVTIYNSTNTKVQNSFQFVVFKP